MTKPRSLPVGGIPNALGLAAEIHFSILSSGELAGETTDAGYSKTE